MPEPMRPQPMTPTFLMIMGIPPREGGGLVARAAARQGRRLEVSRSGRARIPYGDRDGASAANGAVGLPLALGGRARPAVLFERLAERRHARHDRLREDAEDHRRADRRLRDRKSVV